MGTLRERVARAVAAVHDIADWRSCTGEADAAIALITEECAKVVEHTLAREPGGWPFRDPTPQELAAEIRRKLKD